MNAFNNILIGLDLTSMDSQLLDHLPLYVAGPQAPSLNFVHVSYDAQFPVLIGNRFTRVQPDKSILITAKSEMETEVSHKLDPEHFRSKFDVLEGTITGQLLAYANDHRIDLTIMGRKKHPVGTGVASHRFLRGSEGSVLFIPENKTAKLDRVVIATDFSEYSEKVINQVLILIRQQEEMPELHLVNIYDVPTDLAYRISRTEGQFSEIIRENVESVVPDFMKKFDLSGIRHEFHVIENKHYNAAQHLLEFAKNIDTDLLVIGARGHSVVSALLLGSVAERILRYNEELPLLVMRCEHS